MRGKIFGIGLSKTGNTSLVEALRVLGFKIVQFPPFYRTIEEWDGGTDAPVALGYQELDRIFVGSKFILTERPLEDWLRSCAKMWSRRQGLFDGSPWLAQMHLRLYGTTQFNSDAFEAAFRRHHDQVVAYFRTRQSDLLIIDIFSDPTPWATLANFLGVSPPERSFPRVNSGEVIDQITLHLLRRTGDSKLASAITEISAAEVERMFQELRDADAAVELVIDDVGWEVQLIKRNLTLQFGSLEAAREALGLVFRAPNR
jgi:hypothetical protein